METVYIETSVISYLASRPSRDLIVAGHQQISRDWWMLHRSYFDCFVSQAVLDEVAPGNTDQAKSRLDLIADLQVLEATNESELLVNAIMASGALPLRAMADAGHIAVATVSKMNYLLTWNCKHLANAQIIRRIATICNDNGFDMPLICTPEELSGESEYA